MKRWEIALLLALICTLLLGLLTSNGQVDCAQLPQQQVYCWWTVAYPQTEEQENGAQKGEYILKCKVAELWKRLCIKTKGKR